MSQEHKVRSPVARRNLRIGLALGLVALLAYVVITIRLLHGL